MDLSDLLKRIENEDDQVLLREALDCLESGARRAAFIMTWLAIAESLDRRFRLLAERDHTLGPIVRGIEEREGKKSATDAYLLTEAEKTGLVQPSYVARFRHILEMRHIFAHPYAEAPSQEEVQAALVTSVDGLLSLPLLLRHGYVNQMLGYVLETEAFMPDIADRAITLGEQVAGRVDPLLFPYLLTKLLQGTEAIYQDPERQVL